MATSGVPLSAGGAALSSDDGLKQRESSLATLSPGGRTEIDRVVVSLERHAALGFGFMLQPWSIRDLEGSLRLVDGVDHFRSILRFAPGGVAVQRVIDDTPASRAGMRKWDVLVSVNGQDVTNATVTEVNELIRGTQNIKLDLLRDKRIEDRVAATELRVEQVTLSDRLAQAIGTGNQEGGWGDLERHVGPTSETGIVTFDIVIPKAANYGFNPANWNLQALDGRLKACENSEEYKHLLAFAGGVGIPVININDHSPAYSAGLRKFDVVRKVNGTDVTEVSQVCDLIRGSQTDLRLTIVRDCHFHSKYAVLMSSTGLNLPIARKWKCLQARLDSGTDSAVTVHDISITRSRFGFGFVPTSWTIAELDTTLAACAHRDDFADILEFAFDGGQPIGDIIEGSPAAAAGLKRWDVIQFVNGEDVRSWSALTVREWVKKSADTVHLRIIRNVYSSRADTALRQQLSQTSEVGFVDKVLGAGWLYDPAADQRKAEEIKTTLVEAFKSGENIRALDITIPYAPGKPFGFTLQPVNIADLKSGSGWSDETMYEQLLAFAKDGGVPIMSVSPLSPAAAAGLQRWDVVQFVNGVDVRQFKVAEVQRIVKVLTGDLQLRVVRDPTVETRHASIAKQENPGLLALVGKGWLWGKRN